jgi:hypothetical protein
MNFEAIGLGTLVFSLLGMIFLVFRKMSALAKLPVADAVSGKGFFSDMKNRIKNIPALKNFSSEVYLQKIVSRVQVLSL